MRDLRLGRKLKLFFMNHWVKILIASIVILLIILAIVGLMSMESFYRRMTLSQMPLQFLMAGIHAMIFVFMYSTFLRGGYSQMNKNKVKSEDINVKFDEVIGIDEAKEEAWEVVELIKDHKKLQAMGGKILRGILMVGPPGCGKTLLAKAIATESGLPFISMAGSEFVEVFVGVGASRVRKLFQKARRMAYASGGCIVFIDEIEVIGRGRTFSYMGGGQETNSTQNQLLVELDGLGDKRENILCIGATNAEEEIMDKALLRPGRFDRKIYISKPGLKGREKLYRYYLDKVKHTPEIDSSHLARRSVGKTPADIENIIKEAALIAMRSSRQVVEYKDLSQAMERVELGVKIKREMTEKCRRETAYHEAGHLLVLYILHPTDDVFKASIAMRKNTLGVVYHEPREELYTHTKDRLLADIKTALGGYVAEKLKFVNTTSGVTSDFKSAMGIAHYMVWVVGMGGSGYVGDFTIIPESQLSDKMVQALNEDTQTILSSCLKEVETLLTNEMRVLDRFASELLEKEELEYDEIDAIFKEYEIEGGLAVSAKYLPEPDKLIKVQEDDKKKSVKKKKE
ncbi:MAG: AAA family ATPase [Candidatus Theseobacter exili]|nr:AAA family ATPase [Candidatus Theseobacter exili]